MAVYRGRGRGPVLAFLELNRTSPRIDAKGWTRCQGIDPDGRGQQHLDFILKALLYFRLPWLGGQCNPVDIQASQHQCYPPPSSAHPRQASSLPDAQSLGPGYEDHRVLPRAGTRTPPLEPRTPPPEVEAPRNGSAEEGKEADGRPADFPRGAPSKTKLQTRNLRARRAPAPWWGQGTGRAGVVSCSWFWVSPRGWEARGFPGPGYQPVSQVARNSAISIGGCGRWRPRLAGLANTYTRTISPPNPNRCLHPLAHQQLDLDYSKQHNPRRTNTIPSRKPRFSPTTSICTYPPNPIPHPFPGHTLDGRHLQPRTLFPPS